MTYRLGPIDGLRGIAILLVLWFHVWQISWLGADLTFFGHTYVFDIFPTSGYVGVDLFFFISGFCLFYPYAQAIFDGKPLHSVGSFFYRRIIKIVPSYYFCIAVLVATHFASFDSLSSGLTDVVRHLFFVHSLWPNTFETIDGVMWSLGIEVQFYVLFPLIAWAFMRWPIVTFAVMAAIANGWRHAVVGQYGVGFSYNQLPGVIDLFGSGMLSVYVYRWLAVRKPRLAGQKWWWTAVALGGFGLSYAVLIPLFQTRYDQDWPWLTFLYGRPLMCLAFAMASVGSLFALQIWQRALGNPLLLFLSLISYNLYLWHQTIAQILLRAHIPPFAGTDPHLDRDWMWHFSLVAYLAAVAVATVITYALERPLLKRRPFEELFEPRDPAPLDLAPSLPAPVVAEAD